MRFTDSGWEKVTFYIEIRRCVPFAPHLSLCKYVATKLQHNMTGGIS